MKILVTGGAGYIGSHFIKALLSRGISPVVYDNLSTGNRWALISKDFYEADLSDHDAVVDVLRKEKIEAVVHFAASTYVGESVENPMKYFGNNYSNTLNLLNAMVKCGVRRFIFSSSCAVYGIPEAIPITEDMPKLPVSPYGAAKHFIEETLRWYERAYGLKYISLRYFNAAGADPEGQTGEVHDPETHLIPLVLMTAIGKREFIEVYGTDYETPDGTCIRDYIHVMDLAGAHILALDFLEKEGASGAFNLGSGRGYSVMDIINASGKITGKTITFKKGIRREGDPPILIADSSRARSVLGWRPEYEDMETIIRHAWGWVQKASMKGYIKNGSSWK
jgi:UDP-glucose 4-epimerase